MNDFSVLSQGDTFADIFCLCSDEEKSASEVEEEPDTMTDPVVEVPLFVHHRPQLRPRRKRFHTQFPEFVTTVANFVQIYGYSAEARRRTTTGNAMGASLADIVQHVKEQIPELKSKGLSRHTIHLLLVAPRRMLRQPLVTKV